MDNENIPVIGFVGLGVMGGPMCRNMAEKHPGQVIAYDVYPAAFEALADTGARQAASLAELARQADIVFLSLPGGPQVEAVCLGPDGLLNGERRPASIVDLSTTSVAAARKIAQGVNEMGVAYADAPVARTREAARRGELSIMVGADAEMFRQLEPLLRYIGTDVTHCGGVGCGQVVNLANNALVFENTLALAEVMVVAQRAGVDPAVLLEGISKGSGDSFALRNHGYKSLLPREFPEKAFPPEYVVKDLAYVLELAAEVGVSARVASLAHSYYDQTAASGWSGRYYPSVIEVIDRGIPLDRGADTD
jgi:3-hydroxyisobutyrate dehydrogenase-like beta-hydroxyacid dehydrogenase